MKKISVIIPAYNAEKTLMDCYNSILNQTYQNFEVITINDGSSDNTLEIMNNMSKLDNRFVSINTKNGGVSRARNTGFKHSTGDYIQFVDADDTLKPTMFEKLINLIETTDADLAICRFEHPFFQTYYDNKVYDLTKSDELIELCQDPFGLVMPWNKIWKREMLTEAFDVDEKFSEDELFNLANLPNIKKVATTSEILYNYYIPAHDDPALLNSCIGRIIKSVESNSYHNSFYWLGLKLLPKRMNIIKSAIEKNKLPINSVEDLCYYKLIDYSVYTLPAYIGMGVSKQALVQDYIEILSESNFIKGFKSQRKYGFKLKNLSYATKYILVQKFINLCFKIYEQKHHDKNFKISYAFMSVFLSLFAEQTHNLNPVNLNAKLILNMQNSSTKEANYVKRMFEDDIIFYNYNHFAVFSNLV